MNDSFLNKFHTLSIRGRYIYGYLCLQNVIELKHLDEVPEELDNVIREFLPTDRLDLWHEKAEELLPSVILNNENAREFYEYNSYDSVLKLKQYYEVQPQIICDIVEELIWLGISNLYGGFDTDISFGHLKVIIDLLVKCQIDLPDFNIVKTCSVVERNGWGDRTSMSNFVN